MATAAAVEDAISCCICFNVYRDPHALPCLHTLCKPCIDQLAVSGKVECPECREISEVGKIRKDFKTQCLIDANNGKVAGDGSGDVDVCGMCRVPGKVVRSHCKECEHFMCVDCECTHKVMKVCRGHTVKSVKDIVQIAQSKLENCVDQWKMQKTNIVSKANKLEISIKSVQSEAIKQLELTNKHFDKLINDLTKKRCTLVNELMQANEITVDDLKKNKGFIEKICREIQSKIDVLQEVIKGKHASTMNNMVDEIDESLKHQVIQLRQRVHMLVEQEIVPVKVHIDKNTTSIDIGIKLERIPQLDLGTDERSKMLYSDYSKLKTNQYQLSGSQNCNAERICIIQNNLWCTAYTDGIQIYDKNMKLIKKIKHGNYSCVTGLAEWRGDIIVACSDIGPYVLRELGAIVECIDNNTGLHHITQSGDYVQKITDGDFSDVASNGKYVFGLKCNRPHKIVIFTHEKNTWSKTSEIPIKTGTGGQCDKMILKANSLFISLCEENCIKKYSLEGELQQTFGCGGFFTRGLKNPILSDVDVHGNMLVAERASKQLKVYCAEKQTWQVVPVKLNSEPWDAVMDEHNIWVVTCGHRSQIIKFTKIWCGYTLLYKILAFIILIFFLLVAVKWEKKH